MDDEMSAHTHTDNTPFLATGELEAETELHDGILANDGVFITADANGHIDPEKLQEHNKELHTAMYTDIDELQELEAEYETEFQQEAADAISHNPHSHVNHHHHHIVDFTGIADLDPAAVDMDPDHYDFHKDHEEHAHDHGQHKARDLLLKGISVAQLQNDHRCGRDR